MDQPVKRKYSNRMKTLRDAFEIAFRELQKDPKELYSLITWAKNNPDEFYKLAIRLVPNEVTGVNGSDIVLKVINYAVKP